MIRALIGRRTAWLVALLPLLFAGALIGLVGEADRDAGATDSLPRGADSTQAAELRDALPAEDSSVAIVLWSAADGQLTADQLTALQEQATGLGAPAPLVPSEDGTAALAVVPVQAASATQNADLVGDLRDQLREGRPDGVEVAVTGPAAVQADLAAVFDGANTRLLLVDRRRGRAAAGHHLPQPGAVAGPADRRRHRRPPRRGARHPADGASPASPGTSRPSASCRCWSSAPAPTTRCC